MSFYLLFRKIIWRWHICPKRLLTTIRIPIQSEFYFEKLISFQQTPPQTPPRTRGGARERLFTRC